MKERASWPMRDWEVRAILEGRKTQTRRPVKVMRDPDFGCELSPGEIAAELRMQQSRIAGPFGGVGDRLWVRECWQGPLMGGDEFENDYRDNPVKYQNPEYCHYRADGGAAPEFVDFDDNFRCGWRPSIHMPRWASRITLEITGVRVERLSDMCASDAQAEGVTDDDVIRHNGSVEAFAALWKSIYGAEAWKANPWVWVYEFKRIEQSKERAA